MEDFFKNVVKSADGVLVAGVKVTPFRQLHAEFVASAGRGLTLSCPQDVDDFFEHEKTFLLEYHNRVKDASAKSDRMIRSHKSKAAIASRVVGTERGQRSGGAIRHVDRS